MLDRHDVIRVRGARVNNLRDVSVDIPKRQLTVFTGVSGSGKSSLVFGTIAAESQRLINETYPAFVQSFMGSPPRPDVDALENLSAAIVVDQERMGANSRSTVGTATDVNALLRLVWSRLSTPHVGPSFHFSFNLPDGMCLQCEGTGKVSTIDEDQLVDRDRSLTEGAITVPNFTPNTWYWRLFAEGGRLDPDKKLRDYSSEEWDWFMYAPATKVRAGGMNTNYEGLVVKVKRLFLDKETESSQKHVKSFVERVATFTSCPACDGSRLNEPARTATVAGTTMPEALSMQISDLADWVHGLVDARPYAAARPALVSLADLLGSLVEVGLGYLSLDRESGTLSGGEAQRVKMVQHLGSALTDITYVFDEPTVGLHPHDIGKLIDLLIRLRDKGNTVLVVEHKPAVIERADHVVDLGPRAGSEGGEITFTGDVAGLRSSVTLTGEHLDARPAQRHTPRTPTGHLAIRGARTHNLKDVDVDLPLGVLTVITGVAGSGKSSLIHGSIADGSMAGAGEVRVVDQAAWRARARSARAGASNPRSWPTSSTGRTSRTCSTCRSPRRRSSSPAAHHARSWAGSSTSGSATSGWASRCRRSPAVSASGSSSPSGWARGPGPTSSTNRRAACTWPTSHGCSACSTGSWTRGTRSSSSSTTSRSWPTPTGSSTSGRVLGTTAGTSSSRVRRPSWLARTR